jgi:hypothetical protein
MLPTVQPTESLFASKLLKTFERKMHQRVILKVCELNLKMPIKINPTVHLGYV